jgi:hypothetical protein
MKFCFIGNSHLDQFNLHNSGHDFIYAMGASIKGLVNPNSKLQLKDKINNYKTSNPNSILVFCLGQVDIEFGYFYKCIKDTIKYDINFYIDDLIEKYISYLQSIDKKIAVVSINPTTIKNTEHIFSVCFTEDNGKDGFYSENNKSIHYTDVKDMYLNQTYEERFEYNKLFNTKLQKMCELYAIPYIDLWPCIMDSNGIKKEYVPDHEDHHLKNNKDTIILNYFINTYEKYYNRNHG